MAHKKILKNNNSYIEIANGGIYIFDNDFREIYIMAIHICKGLYIELGRSFDDLKEAIKYTRLPIMFKHLHSKNELEYYQIVRMYTDNVKDAVVAVIVCKNNIVTAISFNREILKNKNYTKYNNITLFHNLQIPVSLAGASSRKMQMLDIFSKLIFLPSGHHLEVIEGNNKMEVKLDCGDNKRMLFKFILNKDINKYTLVSINLVE